MFFWKGLLVVQQLVTHHQFRIPQLHRRRTIRVLLPRNYYKEINRRFPVLYLQDGQNLFNTQTAAFGHWKLEEFMARQPLNRQAILVGIDHGVHQRMNEYAPYKNGKKGGEGDVYLRFIEQTLKPFIDANYRTWPHREATGIAGASMGGLIAFYAGLNFSHIFGKAGVLSPSFWFNPEVIRTPAIPFPPGNRVYICGSKTETRSMAATLQTVYWALKNSGLSDEQFRVVLRDRGRHSETFWRREFKPMFEWLFPATVFD